MIKKEIIQWLASVNTRALFDKADKTRKKYCGNKIFIRGLIEFSNVCVRNCKFCGLRRDNKRIKRYRLQPAEILKISGRIARKGIKTIVLQSGDDFYYTRRILCGLIKGIKDRFPDIAITLSLGERPLSEYKAFREYGADRYLLKHETINEKFYSSLCPGQSLKKRIRILEYLKKIGFQVGVGNIVGLPGQTLDDLAEDIMFFKDFKPDMLSVGPFLPQRQTPFFKNSVPDIKLVLKCIALSRIVTRESHMPVTTSLATLSIDKGIVLGLKSGCNVIMVNFTPHKQRKHYRIYDNKIKVDIKIVGDMLKKARRKICLERGDSFKFAVLGILAGVYIGFGASLFTLEGSDTVKYVGAGIVKILVGAVVFC